MRPVAQASVIVDLMVCLPNITARSALLRAVAEYDRLGQADFLKTYGFGPVTESASALHSGVVRTLKPCPYQLVRCCRLATPEPTTLMPQPKVDPILAATEDRAQCSRAQYPCIP